jgi:hypothetical protein
MGGFLGIVAVKAGGLDGFSLTAGSCVPFDLLVLDLLLFAPGGSASKRERGLEFE